MLSFKKLQSYLLKNNHHKKEIFKYAACLFVPSFFVVSLIIISIYLITFTAEKRIILRAEEATVKEESKYILSDISTVMSDLLYLSQSHEMVHMVSKKFHDLEHCDLTKDFFQYAKNRKIYDQIRLIDRTGKERIRVNFNGGIPSITPQEELQDKRHRYYFTDTMKLSSHEIFISSFDLNIENKQLEKPIKPMIRFAVPIFNKNGSKQGMIILNYLGKILLTKLDEYVFMRRSRSILLNNKGYYLKGMNEEEAWGFMYDDRQDQVVTKRFPVAGLKIMQEEKGQFENEKGVFTFNTIYPFSAWKRLNPEYSLKSDGTHNDNYYWKYISYIPHDVLYAQSNYWKHVIIIILSLLAFVMSGIAWRFSKTTVLKKEADAELLIAKERAEQASQAKGRFLANMSHEIRTPLNAILGFSAILNEEIKDPAFQNYLHSITVSSKSLLTIINDILDLSKVESGKIELKYTAINMKQIVNDMRYMFEQKITGKGLDFFVEIEDDFPEAVLLDEMRVRQVLINLLGNAVKFTEDGFIKLSAVCRSNSVSQSHVDIIITVEDTGAGIEADQLETIFDAFEQQHGKNAPKIKGTGLGLAISKKLMGLMGGSIGLESSINKGSTFSLVFNNVQIASTFNYSGNVGNDLHAIVFERSHILIIDDIEMNRKLIRGLLSIFNFRFSEAVNGQEGLDVIKNDRPDLVLLDMKMPVMNGYEFIEIIKNNKQFSTIPLIAVTASVMQEQEESVKHDVDAYLRKPISREELVTAIMKFLPYTIKGDETEQGQDNDTVEIDAGKSEKNNEHEKGNLSELFAVLDRDMLPQWSEIKDMTSVDEIATFVNSCKMKAEKYQYSDLADWCDTISTHIKKDNLKEIQTEMKSFPEIVSGVKMTIEDFRANEG